jgi:hypothetical protein
MRRESLFSVETELLSVLSMDSLSIVRIITGLLAVLGAFVIWDRVRHQPEGIPMYSLRGHKKLTKKNAYVGAVVLGFLGVFYLITGLLD